MSNTQESYWEERNALVDAVLAIQDKASKNYTLESTFDWTEEERKAYWAAREALEAFDAAHGGTPIL